MNVDIRARNQVGSLFRRVAVVVGLMLALPSAAHIVKEEPWHPVAASYLRALFYANLKPVPWVAIAHEYEQPLTVPGYEAKTVYELLSVVDDAEAPRTAAIREAIAAQDRQALYAASTRAVSALIRLHLDRAEARLTEPGAARRDVITASGLFRAFEQEILPTADPEAFRALGRAWLEMSSSVGSPGMLGAGEVAADPAKFANGRKQIENYLLKSYEPEQFTARHRLMPIPEVSAGSDASNDLARRLPPGTNLNDQTPLPTLRLNFEARGIDEADLFLVAYGDMLFDSPQVFGEPARSLGLACSTCHNRSDINRDFFIPGVSHQPGAIDVDGEFFNPRFNDHRSDSLDIPSLRGLRFTAPYGRDGRVASLRDFIRNVIVNEFNGPEPTPLTLDALVAYSLEFDWLPTPLLNPDGTLKAKADDAQKRGEALFNTSFEGMGNRSCATCHVPSSNFLDGRQHDIGSGERTAPDSRDAFFDTPTLINIAYTAPYFHDGSLPSLAAVVDWFNEQHDLKLTAGQRADLTAYLEAVGTGEDPYEVFDDQHTPFRLAWEELSTFLSTLDTLIPARDTHHATLLLDTVEPDLKLDLTLSRDLETVAPRIYEIAGKLEQIREAIVTGDWQAAARLNEEYKALAEAYDPVLR